jgi:hypothetical protein
MATNFPTSLDSLTNPITTDKLNNPSHAAQHANVNDAVEALEAKVGINSSAVTSTLDYKVTQVEGKVLPTGGAVDQVLAKASGSNYDVEWVDSSVDIIGFQVFC